MKKTNMKIARAAALSAVAATMGAAVLPVNAETANSDVTKNEDVFIVLNTDGTVSKTTVSDTLHSDSGFDNYDDKSNVADAQNLKSTDALTKSSNGYTWNTTDKDIYYQGTYSGDLPLGVSIGFTLDGKSINEQDLLGQSGHVKITIELTNNKYQYYKVNGKTYKIAMPIAAVTGALLNKDVFKNVTVSTGNVTSDSAHDIVASVSLPGMKDSLEDILTAKSLDSIDEYLNDEVVIEADATDYEAPEIMLAASTDTDQLKTELGGTDLSSVWSDIDKLQSATNELIDGTKALYDGAAQLSDGAAQLDSGAQSLVNGAESLTDGAEQVSAGAASLETGLGQLSSKSAELNAGAKQIEDGVFASASSQINEDAAVKATGKTYTLTADNYADVLAQLLEINDVERAQAKAEIKAKLEKAANTTLDDSTVNALIYMASIHNTSNGFEADLAAQAARLTSAKTIQGDAAAYTTSTAAQQNKTVAALLNAVVTAKQDASYVLSDTEYAAAKSAIIAAAVAKNPQLSQLDPTTEWNTILTASGIDYSNENAVKAFETSVFKSKLTADSVYESIASQLKASNSSLTDANIAMVIAYTADTYKTLDTASFTKTSAAVADAAAVSMEIADSAAAEGQQKIKSTLSVLVADSASYQTNNQKMKELQSSLDSLVAFVEGLRTYTNGVDTAYAGSQTLASGAASLAEGASSLSSGATQLKTGIDTLSVGISTLKDGAQTLMEGMTTYNDEGISKVTGSTEINDLKNADELLKQMKQSGEDYNNYSGISEGTTGSVKFVYKVTTIKTEKESAADTSNSDVTHVNDGSNFWSRLVNLFVFWK